MTTLTIPDAWFAGFLLGHPECTVADAVNYWQDQERMEAQFQAAERFTIEEEVFQLDAERIDQIAYELEMSRWEGEGGAAA